jgi:PadR family transcriptional regulator
VVALVQGPAGFLKQRHRVDLPVAEVQQISGDRVRLRAGTLYTALDRLRADGLIGVDREEIVEGRLRRYYRLTPEGTRRLAAEAARLQANATAALTRLKPSGVVT